MKNRPPSDTPSQTLVSRRDFIRETFSLPGISLAGTLAGGVGGAEVQAKKNKLKDARIEADLKLLKAMESLASSAAYIRKRRIRALSEEENVDSSEIERLSKLVNLSSTLRKDCASAYEMLSEMQNGRADLKTGLLAGGMAGGMLLPVFFMESSGKKPSDRRKFLYDMLKVAGGASVGTGAGYAMMSKDLTRESEELTRTLQQLLNEYDEIKSVNGLQAAKTRDVIEERILEAETLYKSEITGKLQRNKQSINNGMLGGGGVALALLSVFAIREREQGRG